MVTDAVKEALFILAGAPTHLNIMNAAQESTIIKVIIQGMPFIIFLRHFVFLQHLPTTPVDILSNARALLVQLSCPRLCFLFGYLLKVGGGDRAEGHCLVWFFFLGYEFKAREKWGSILLLQHYFFTFLLCFFVAILRNTLTPFFVNFP